MSDVAQIKTEVQEKIVNLYSKNIQTGNYPKEFSPVEGDGSTEGFLSKEFTEIKGTKTDKRGRTIFVGTKG